MNRKLVWLLQLDSSKSVSGILGVVHYLCMIKLYIIRDYYGRKKRTIC